MSRPASGVELPRVVALQKADVSSWHPLFRGMTPNQLSHAEEASKWLKQAVGEHEKQKGSYDWQDRLHAEAQELIKSPR
jgi:hypothetical protein